jgi:stage V sporulation protein R
MDKEVKELEKALEQIWDIATNKFGLDPFPTHFEIVPATVMYEIGSYALPGRYSHWTFGKAYHKMKTMYDFGLSKIYEVVINSNPAYAFLLENNSLIQNKLVIAHVLGHVDFFKNNVYFSQTNRRMVDDAAMHARRINEYEFKYGRKVVEQFLDAVLSIEEHVDPNFFIKKRHEEKKTEEKQQKQQVEGRYDDLFSLGKRSEPEPSKEGKAGEQKMEPEKDVVYFIMQNSPILEPWQRDLMSMIHDEMLYFVPQMQTKILNEGWACLRGDSLVLTEEGFTRFDQLYSSGKKIGVAGGGAGQVYRITDFHKEELVPTVRIRTRRGLMIEGALKHRVLLADGSWAYLKDLRLGDRVAIECGTNVWPRRKQPLNFVLLSSTVTDGEAAGVATPCLSAVAQASKVSVGWKPKTYQTTPAKQELSTRTPLQTSGFLDEEIAWVVGYFIGDGYKTESGICLNCGEQALAVKLREKIGEAFGLCATLQWDPSEGDGGWRVCVESRNLLDLLYWLGIELQDTASSKKIPPPILRSPKEVMSAFLRGYFDADADAGSAGICLSSSSEELIRSLQIVLLNYGILSSQQPQQDGGIQLSVSGASAARFLDEIGFSLPRKQQALREYVEGHQWFKKEELADEIISIEPGCGAVFDITVETKHTYVANGMLHHNSFWHARIMRELDLPTADHLEFAELHAGVVSPHKGQLNPYHLGYKILEDIERRWDNPTPEEREKFGRQGGEGRAKLFEVRELDNDVSLLRNYLTEELCEELDLFVYELVDDEEWTVTEKQWERVRDQLVANMTNFGFPYIEVVDGDYDRNRELYLRHRYEGVELDLKYARKVLEYLYQLWGRPVHLETQVDNEPLVMHFDGEDHDEN